MNPHTCTAYRHTLRRIHATFASTRDWSELPALLDRLDALRTSPPRGAPHDEHTWVQRFVAALRAHGQALDAQRAREAARSLWPWLGAYDPEPLALGRWEALPRSYA